jgi:hypothetical protein
VLRRPYGARVAFRPLRDASEKIRLVQPPNLPHTTGVSLGGSGVQLALKKLGKSLLTF